MTTQEQFGQVLLWLIAIILAIIFVASKLKEWFGFDWYL